MTTNDFTIYSRSDYFQKLGDDIDKTRNNERVILATMSFEPDEPEVAELMQKVNAAAKRGVVVHLAVDAFPFMIKRRVGPGPLVYRKELPTKLRGRFGLRLASLQAFKDSGGHYTIINRPARTFSVPHAGRCHIKTAIVNDKVYIGGCNLSEAEIDVMVNWHDAHTADWLADTILHIMKTGHSRAALGDKDTAFKIDEKTQLLLDAGVPKQSSIYDKALELIDTAQEWIFFTSQYFPGGSTGQHLLQAQKRGVRVQILYGHPLHQGLESPGHYLHKLRERTRLPKDFFKYQLSRNMPLLHAKVLATEQAALVGSHNLAPQGVRLGTAEIALLRHDMTFAQRIAKNLSSQLSQAGMDLSPPAVPPEYQNSHE